MYLCFYFVYVCIIWSATRVTMGTSVFLWTGLYVLLACVCLWSEECVYIINVLNTLTAIDIQASSGNTSMLVACGHNSYLHV